MLVLVLMLIIVVSVCLLEWGGSSSKAEEIEKHYTFGRILDYIDVIIQIYQADQEDLHFSNLYVFADDKEIMCGTVLMSDYVECQLDILKREAVSPAYSLKNEVMAITYKQMIDYLLEGTNEDCKEKFYDLSMSVEYAHPYGDSTWESIVIGLPQMTVPYDIGEYSYIDCLYRECKHRYPEYKVSKGRMARLFIDL